jgi:hypothetical protein
VREPPISGDDALILLRLQDGGILGRRAVAGRRFAGQGLLGNSNQDS